MSPWVYAAALAACAAGACLRYAFALVIRGPWSTLAANVTGSAALGAFAGLAVASDRPELLLVAGAGFAGGLTTFSALALDAATLWRGASKPLTLSYCALTLVAGVAAAALGWQVVS